MGEGDTPQARSTGAFLVGVGIHPLALAAYESLHLGGVRRMGPLYGLGILLVITRGGIQSYMLTLHPLWWLAASAVVTSWWIVREYPRTSTSSHRRLFHIPGLLAAMAVGGSLYCAQNFWQSQ